MILKCGMCTRGKIKIGFVSIADSKLVLTSETLGAVKSVGVYSVN